MEDVRQGILDVTVAKGGTCHFQTAALYFLCNEFALLFVQEAQNHATYLAEDMERNINISQMR